MRDLVFIDVETTGLTPGYHEIIDIAAVRTTPDAGRVIDTWWYRVCPRYPERLSEGAQRVNEYTPEGWTYAVESDYALWTDFADFTEGCTPVCHNPSFDRAFIQLATHAEGVDLRMDYHWIGTESIAWPLLVAGAVQNVSLKTLCRHFDLEPEPLPHTGVRGAETCRALYLKLIESINTETEPCTT